MLLFSNSSLVIWLYELAYAILSEKKMTWYGLMSGVIYNIPGIVISGRDALMIFFVSTVIVLFYCGNYGKKVLGLEGKMYKKILMVQHKKRQFKCLNGVQIVNFQNT